MVAPIQEHLRRCALVCALLPLAALAQDAKTAPEAKTSASAVTAITGFRNSFVQLQLERQFLAVPSPHLAEEHMRVLCSAPHVAGSEEDRQTAEYVARKFREAGLETRIDEYKVWMNYPTEIRVDMIRPEGTRHIGPSRERVDGDPYQNDPRVMVPFMGGSRSGDVEAEAVYANYGRPEDFKRLQEMGIAVKGKIAVVRYGKNFRGVKSMVAEENGAIGVIIYSDPIDDGYFQGDTYPKGSYRPETAVQRGSIELMFKYPGDPTTPGVASLPTLSDGQRIPPEQAQNLPAVPTTPLSYGDASPILRELDGPASPREWQGALPFTYHVGPGPAKVRLHLVQDYRLRTIWNVIGTLRGTQYPEQWVIAGNHRDAWVFGAADPGSGTAAMLEAVHGIGELLKSGWHPRRTIVLASWDAEEQGLIGSTEYTEQYAAELRNAVAYFNMDIGVSGPNFGASTVPSLKNFLVEISRAVPSPGGGTVFDSWKDSQLIWHTYRSESPEVSAASRAGSGGADILVGDLGSGSDYTAFLQHLGVPATDIGSAGPNGVYHSVFDNLAWFKKYVDPTFVYEQEMARIFGLEILRMSQADLLPLDYEEYALQIKSYLQAAKSKAGAQTNWDVQPDFAPALQATAKLMASAKTIKSAAANPRGDAVAFNKRLLAAERAFLVPEGLPGRAWYKHAIYAPGEYSGYQAITLPGVNDAIDHGDLQETGRQLKRLTQALERAADALAAFR
jgi:N-acetylated-alpha-linked acidic dipeptidase